MSFVYLLAGTCVAGGLAIPLLMRDLVYSGWMPLIVFALFLGAILMALVLYLLLARVEGRLFSKRRCPNCGACAWREAI